MVESAKTEMSPPERPQHPKRPFPYREEFVEFDGGADGVKLAGTITLPEKKEGDAAKGLKYPAVILVTGSGPQDRDETLMGHKPFLVIADHLTKKGIAVLRYDERGVGKSTGSFEEATSKDFATDVVAAIKFLAKHAEVDASRIGIVGHSEGGLIAPMVAAKHPELLKHIVLLAGPGIDGGEVLVGQSAAIYRAMEGGEDEIKKNVEIIKEVNQAIRDKMSDDDFDKMIEKISEHAAAEQSTDEELDEESQAMSVLTLKSRLSMFKTPWFRYFIEYDPATSLKDVKCSVLALNGEKDLQVLIEPNFQGIRSALESGGNKDFELVAYPELNHLFQKSKTGSPSEYSVLTETFSVDVMDKIADWVHAH
jgi:dipeptidyl aminopeptidase/acylaminoacyl peptidase